jgi:hypothetical protein
MGSVWTQFKAVSIQIPRGRRESDISEMCGSKFDLGREETVLLTTAVTRTKSEH